MGDFHCFAIKTVITHFMTVFLLLIFVSRIYASSLSLTFIPILLAVPMTLFATLSKGK